MIFNKKKEGPHYKFKALSVYAWDRTIGDKKKFRRVFDQSELTYLSAELSFYNKLFDEKNWECELRIVAHKIEEGGSKQICEKKDSINIGVEENLFTYSFGWGDDKRGKFWKPGTYEWEAYIDGVYVGSASFYVEQMDGLDNAQNPYFEVLSLRTYEAPEGDLDASDRVYLKSFEEAVTRYIMGELRFRNLVPHEWHCEMFFHIFDDTGMSIGCSDSFFVVTPEDETGEVFTVTSGWGSSNAGTWVSDNYTMEVVFMDRLIAVIPFSIGEKAINRISEYEALLNDETASIFNDTLEIKKSNAEIETDSGPTSDHTETETSDKSESDDDSVEILVDDRPLEEILQELDSLIGLESIKKKVRDYINYVSFLQFREESGIEEEEELNLHSVFTGNPGTGKTTVVKLLGKIYQSMGLLSKGHVHAVEANDLISGYIRQSAKDTKEAIKKAKGGILFIDEAYMLFKEGANTDFGPEAIAALITEMSDGEGDIAIMVAGYPKEMETFLGSNPGLKSRFRNYFHFEDYTPDELFEIAQFAADKKAVTFSKTAATTLKHLLTDAYRKRDRTFGNARFAHALVDEAKINMGIRIMKDADPETLTKKQLKTIEAADIEDVNKSQIQKKLQLAIDEGLLKEATEELNALTGLQNIKQEVRELIKLSSYYKEINRDILKAFSMHSVFLGNPGTGKTTVARIIAKIYKALGLLERGHLIDADGSDLVAGYVGQTSLKTKELIDKAIGGILFIDEAYAITEGNNSDFGKKAIAALIKEMEDRRSEFGLVVAGYTKNMEGFLESNPGLQSRFDQQFHFEDFSESELLEIAVNMLADKGLKPDKEAQAKLQQYIDYLHHNRDRFFGNARSIRKIVEKATRNQELRMADMSKDKRSKKLMQTLNVDDIKEFVPNKAKDTAKQSLGFKFGGEAN